MPLFARLLGRRAGPQSPPQPPPPPPPPQPPPEACAPPADQNHRLFEFSKEQVRVLLFKECDKTGRKLLFDSAAVQRVTVNDIKKPSDFPFTLFPNKKESKDNKNVIKSSSKSNIVEISQGYGYKCSSPNSDVNLLGEMIFGAVAMNFKGMSLKVHILNAPDRLMCTKVFCTSPNIRRRSRVPSNNFESLGSTSLSSYRSNLDCATNIESSVSSNRRSSLNYTQNNYFTSSHRNMSTSLDMQPLSEGWSIFKDDSGIHGDFSSQSSVSSCSNDFFSSYNEKDDCDASDDIQYFQCLENFPASKIGNNLQWRLNRHLCTSLNNTPFSLQNSYSNTSIHPSSYDSQFISSNSEASTSDSLSSNSNSSCAKSLNHTKRKLGLAIIISLSKDSEMEMFKFLMEHGMLVEAALDRLRLTVKSICYERHSFITKMSIATEETAQWLVDLLSGPRLRWPLWLCLAGTPKKKSPDRLANDFLRDLCFLLKTMDTKDTYFFMSTLITNVLIYHLGWVNSVSPYNAPTAVQQKELDYLNNSHPYNPLWAQIGELYGAIGTPPRISRTFVCSKRNASTVNRILCVLSYFIRCGEVKRFDVKSKKISWETLDYLVDNHKPDGLFQTIESDVNSDSGVDSSDYIEMSTFSSNTALIDGNIKSNVGLTNLKENERNIIHRSEAFYENKTGQSKSLKRTKSCNSKLKNSDVLNQYNTSFNLSESSLCSISTLVPSTECLLKNEDAVFASNNCTLIDKGQINQDVSVSKIFNDCSIHGVNSDHIQNLNAVNNGILEINSNHDICDNSKQSFHKSNSTESQNNSKQSTQNKNEFEIEENIPILNNVEKRDVLFVLGENEPLIGIRNIHDGELSSGFNSPDTKSLTSNSDDANDNFAQVTLSSESLESTMTETLQKEVCCVQKSQCKHSKLKKHSGVKFEFDKYPQIVTNYMKSKNLELLDRHMIGKPGNLKIEGIEFEGSTSLLSIPNDTDSCDNCALNAQILQTPSNASELEFTSDIPPNECEIQYANEKMILPVIVEPVADHIKTIPKIFVRTKLENTLIVNCKEVHRNEMEESEFNDRVRSGTSIKYDEIIQEEKIELPIPSSVVKESDSDLYSVYYHSLISGVTDHYIPDMVLQGTVNEGQNWETQIKKDLHLQSRTASGGAVCLYADIDDWTVKVLGFNGGTAGMSTLVATMLDTLFHMYKSKVPAKQCLKFIESKLKEFCVRSKTLAEMLIDTDFCDMNYLTKTLTLEPNDVPLLMAIASTHSPQVALKYGISYR